MTARRPGSLRPLLIAIELERLGREFYGDLASACDVPRVARICLLMRREEEKHHATFAGMLRRLDEARDWLPDDDFHERSRGRLIREVIPRPSEVRRVGVRGEPGSALRMALEMERRTVAFYEGLRRLLPGEAEPLGLIIREELRHVDLLGGLLAQVVPAE